MCGAIKVIKFLEHFFDKQRISSLDWGWKKGRFSRSDLSL